MVAAVAAVRIDSFQTVASVALENHDGGSFAVRSWVPLDERSFDFEIAFVAAVESVVVAASLLGDWVAFAAIVVASAGMGFVAVALELACQVHEYLDCN